MLALAIPMLLILLGEWVVEAVEGVIGAFSGREVVQITGSMSTGLAVGVGLAAIWGVGRLCGVNLLGWVSLTVLLYGALLIVPLLLVVGWGAQAGIGMVLEGRGYRYCTFHVVEKDRGESGYSVYVRGEGCERMRGMFPAHTIVPGGPEAFDLPKG